MKDLKSWLLISMVILSCCGCIVTSINPFYTPEAVVTLPDVVGSWELVEFDEEEYQAGKVKPWIIDADQILTFDTEGRGGPLDYKIFKVGDALFVDVIPTDNGTLDAPDFWIRSVWPVHSLFKLTLTGDQMILTPLNYEWFEEKMKSDEIKLPMVKAHDEPWGFYTASSREWSSFLLKYKDQENFFRDSSQIILRKK